MKTLLVIALILLAILGFWAQALVVAGFWFVAIIVYSFWSANKDHKRYQEIDRLRINDFPNL